MTFFTPKMLALLTAILILLIGYALTVHKSSVDARFENLQKSKGLTKYLAALGQETAKVLPDRLVKTSRVKAGSINDKLRRAGNPWGINATEYTVLKIGATMAGLLMGFLAYYACKDYLDIIPWYAFVLCFALTGYIFPDHQLGKMEKERLHAFRKDLPEALDLLVISTSVSNSMEASIQTVTPLLKQGIVKDEFKLVSKDLMAGRGLVDALTNLAERAPSPDIEAFVNVVIQAQSTGTDMSDALRRRSKTSRQEYIAMLDTKIASLESTIMIMLMPTMVIALVLVSIAPSLSNIFTSLGGM